MSLYEAFLIQALRTKLPQSSKIEAQRDGAVSYILIPEMKSLIEIRGLWYSNGHAPAQDPAGERIAKENGWRCLIIEESSSCHGVYVDEISWCIGIQRMQARSIRAGLRRCVHLSESALSILAGQTIRLSDEQIESCAKYALDHTRFGKHFTGRKRQAQIGR